MNALPRYLLMVFALAGDSTITRERFIVSLRTKLLHSPAAHFKYKILNRRNLGPEVERMSVTDSTKTGQNGVVEAVWKDLA